MRKEVFPLLLKRKYLYYIIFVLLGLLVGLIIGGWEADALSSSPTSQIEVWYANEVFVYPITSYNRNGAIFTRATNINGSVGVTSVFLNPSSPTSGSYFSFMLHSTFSQFSVISAAIQLSDGTFVSCNVTSTGALGTDYMAHCDLTGYNQDVSIYKYGWTFAGGDSTSRNAFGVSYLYYFKANSVELQIIQAQNNTTNAIEEQTEETVNAIDNVANGIQDMMNSHMPDNSSESDADTSDFDNYEDAQATIQESIDEADMSVVDVSYDIPTSNFIWTTMKRLFDTNSLIFSSVITILSIGIIKLMLNR